MSLDEVPPPGTALVEELDKRLLVQLRDGRKIVGILRCALTVLPSDLPLLTQVLPSMFVSWFLLLCLQGRCTVPPSRTPMRVLQICRSFDQFANLVLEAAVELIIVGNLYAEITLGLYVVRGENVVLLGELDATREVPQPLQQVR